MQILFAGILLVYLLSFIKSLGYGGVDIFMFVSGFGLSCSLNKNQNQLTFYSRRIMKIYPAYLPLLLIWCLINIPNLEKLSKLPGIFIGNVLGFSFWTGMAPSFNWYIQTAFIFYLLTPILFMIINKGKKYSFVMLLVLSGLINISFFEHSCLIAVSRLFIFIIGDRKSVV